MAENNSSATLKTAEGEYPAPLIDGAWYWVRYFGLFKETEAPAQYKEACCAFYSVSFSGVPVAEVEILAPLAVAAQAAPAAVAVPEWDKVRRGLAMLLLGFAGRTDCTESAAEAVLDAATEPGMPLEGLRTALAPTPALPATEDFSAGDLAEVQAEPVAAKFFSFDPADDLVFHETEDDARSAAQRAIDLYRDEAADGWSEEVERVCWGLVIQQSAENVLPDTFPPNAFAAGAAGSLPSVDYALTPLYTAPQAQPADALDAARLDFLETQKRREARDGGYSAFYSLHLPAMAAGPWQATHGGEYDHKSLREAIDAAMAAAQEGGKAAKEA